MTPVPDPPGEHEVVTSAPHPRATGGPGLAWEPRRLLLGLLFALPAAIVTAFDVPLGIAMALGVLPAASLGLPPRRAGRLRYLLVGSAVALGMTIGSVLAGLPVLALIVLFAACVAAALFSTTGPVGALVLALGVPMIGIGLSFTDVESVLPLAVAMLTGAVWCLLVSLAWPEREQRPPAPDPHPPAMLGFGIRLGLAAVIAATIGFVLGLDHVGWAVGAVLLVMRPSTELVLSRALARAASVVLGALVGGAFMLLIPPPWLMGVAALLALATLTALSGSRWYITGFFGTFLVFMLLLQGDPADVAHRFWERSLETFLGVTLALLFGVLIPWVGTLRRPRPTVAGDEVSRAG